MESRCVLQDHYDDERNKTVFHNITSDLQDQDQRPIFFVLIETGLVLRPTVSDHITDIRAALHVIITQSVSARCCHNYTKCQYDDVSRFWRLSEAATDQLGNIRSCVVKLANFGSKFECQRHKCRGAAGLRGRIGCEGVSLTRLPPSKWAFTRSDRRTDRSVRLVCPTGRSDDRIV